MSKGHDPERIAKWTLEQAYAVLDAINDEDEFRMALAGAKPKEEPKQLTFQALMSGGLS